MNSSASDSSYLYIPEIGTQGTRTRVRNLAEATAAAASKAATLTFISLPTWRAPKARDHYLVGMDLPDGPRLQSRWRVRYCAGEPVAVVQVRNLQAVVQAGQDAWGREGKSQPFVISAELFLGGDFGTAVSADKVTSHTVHYGLLSKTILSSLDTLSTSKTSGGADAASHLSLRAVLDVIWSSLTGTPLGGAAAGDSSNSQQKPFLDVSILRFLEVSILLPKASLLGSGVRLTGSALFGRNTLDDQPTNIYSVSLAIEELRLPTLIGINENERNARQVVVVSVELDEYDFPMDIYTDVESTVVKVSPQGLSRSDFGS